MRLLVLRESLEFPLDRFMGDVDQLLGPEGRQVVLVEDALIVALGAGLEIRNMGFKTLVGGLERLGCFGNLFCQKLLGGLPSVGEGGLGIEADFGLNPLLAAD